MSAAREFGLFLLRRGIRLGRNCNGLNPLQIIRERQHLPVRSIFSDTEKQEQLRHFIENGHPTDVALQGEMRVDAPLPARFLEQVAKEEDPVVMALFGESHHSTKGAAGLKRFKQELGIPDSHLSSVQKDKLTEAVAKEQKR